MDNTSMARRKKLPPTAYPMYEWALDVTGFPVHINHATHNTVYICPVCQGRMVARLGDIKQHHFAHDRLQACTPENVARIAATHWLVHELDRCITGHQGVILTYPCPLCKQNHTADLLSGVTQAQAAHDFEGSKIDVALLDAAGELKTAICFERPDSDIRQQFRQRNIPVLVINPRRGEFTDLAVLLGGAVILGGVCQTQETATDDGVVTDVNAMRNLLVQAVSQPPHNVHGPLDKHDDLTHVFTLGEKKLWLPPILWERAIGGLHHSITPALQVITQEWPQDDGATIALYYITAKDTYAIAVRRFPPGQPAYARLKNAIFHTPRLTAALIAKSFAEN